MAQGDSSFIQTNAQKRRKKCRERLETLHAVQLETFHAPPLVGAWQFRPTPWPPHRLTVLPPQSRSDGARASNTSVTLSR